MLCLILTCVVLVVDLITSVFHMHLNCFKKFALAQVLCLVLSSTKWLVFTA